MNCHCCNTKYESVYENTLKCPLCGKRFALYSYNKETKKMEHGYRKVLVHILDTQTFADGSSMGCKSPKALEYSELLEDWGAYRDELDSALESERTESFKESSEPLNIDRFYLADNGLIYTYVNEETA